MHVEATVLLQNQTSGSCQYPTASFGEGDLGPFRRLQPFSAESSSGTSRRTLAEEARRRASARSVAVLHPYLDSEICSWTHRTKRRTILGVFFSGINDVCTCKGRLCVGMQWQAGPSGTLRIRSLFAEHDCTDVGNVSLRADHSVNADKRVVAATVQRGAPFQRRQGCNTAYGCNAVPRTFGVHGSAESRSTATRGCEGHGLASRLTCD